MRLLTGVVVGAVALVGAATAPAATITRAVTTASYRVVLDLGPAETMYTPAQLKTMHPRSGEVMLANAMAMGGMSMGAGMTRHLELHVFSRATGKVLTGLMPKISLTDTSAKTMMAERVAAVARESPTTTTATTSRCSRATTTSSSWG
jgi:hypothetical protein